MEKIVEVFLVLNYLKWLFSLLMFREVKISIKKCKILRVFGSKAEKIQIEGYIIDKNTEHYAFEYIREF